jgi:hypothetical protein
VILPFVALLVFLFGSFFFFLLGILVLRRTEPRVGRNTWSVFAFVIGAWPASVGASFVSSALVIHVRPAFMAITAIVATFLVGGILGGLLATYLFDLIFEFIASHHSPNSRT